MLLPYPGGTLAFLKHGAGGNIDASLAQRPAAACLLERAPRTGIEAVVLRANIRHIEAIVHRLITPFHIGRGTHVPSVVARTAIIGRRDTIRLCHLRVGQEVVGAGHGALRLLGRELPSHPVGLTELLVKRKYKACVRDDLLGNSLQGGGQFYLARRLGRLRGLLLFGYRLLLFGRGLLLVARTAHAAHAQRDEDDEDNNYAQGHEVNAGGAVFSACHLLQFNFCNGLAQATATDERGVRVFRISYEVFAGMHVHVAGGRGGIKGVIRSIVERIFRGDANRGKGAPADGLDIVQRQMHVHIGTMHLELLRLGGNESVLCDIYIQAVAVDFVAAERELHKVVRLDELEQTLQRGVQSLDACAVRNFSENHD